VNQFSEPRRREGVVLVVPGGHPKMSASGACGKASDSAVSALSAKNE
jgi:hypothetical protein